MKHLIRIASVLTLLVLLCAPNEATAQKKKGLAKQIVGKWAIDEMTFDLDQAKADSTEKAKYEMMKSMFSLIKEQMKGKVIFDFKANGTFENLAKQDNGTEQKTTGKWAVEGNKLKLTPDESEKRNDMPESLDAKIEKNVLRLSAPAQKGSAMIIIMNFNRMK